MITVQEYQKRRNRVFEAMNALQSADKQANADMGVAILQGEAKESSHTRFRQVNDLMYLCPIETPHSYLVLDGRDKSSHLFLPYQPLKGRDREEPLLTASDPDEVIKVTGVDEVHGLDALAGYLERVRHLYTPLRAGEGAMQSWDTLERAQQERSSDPWDGRLDRMRHFIKHLRERLPAASIHNLSGILDDLRLVKSEAEIALLRHAGRLSAFGLIEAMRATKAGVMEYQIDAIMRFVYLNNGARDVSYRAIIAGTKNAWYGHYNANDQVLNDGDLLLVDCGPDYKYYASDITRMWPVSGVYDPVQRQLYEFMVDYHKTFLRLLRPGVTAEQVRDEAREEMAAVVARTRFAKPIYQEAAQRALDFPYHLSHPVGMAVHDVGHYRGKVLKPGIVLTVDPQLIIPEERLYIRVEDTVVMTENGIENLTVDAPLELDDVEACMKEASILDRYPQLST
ncbi:MAG: aminopeptidase P N-terminal domain-containing protein [Trueperaceae bacterium]|nr:aminopeptidase P N-terminal domain-containing protein [Trueperaceae bacterium]